MEENNLYGDKTRTVVLGIMKRSYDTQKDLNSLLKMSIGDDYKEEIANAVNDLSRISLDMGKILGFTISSDICEGSIININTELPEGCSTKIK